VPRLLPACFALALAACGSAEGSLDLQLVRSGFEDPYQQLTEMVVRARGGAELEELTRFSVAPSAGRLELGLLSARQQLLEIEGRAGGQPVARGVTRLLSPGADLDLVELVPFASPRAATALPLERALTEPSLVDGSLREWRASPSLVLEEAQRIAGPSVTPRDLRAELALAWTPDKLFLALRVSDDCPGLRAGAPAGSCGAAVAPDRVALGFDGGDDGGAGWSAGDFWIELRATQLKVVQGDLDPAQISVVLAPLADGHGWALELTLEARALGRTALGPGDHVGFDLVLIDEDPGQSEPTVLRWSGGEASADAPTAPAAMGTLGFGEPGSP